MSQMVTKLGWINLNRRDHFIILGRKRVTCFVDTSDCSSSHNEGYDCELGDFSAALVLDEVDDLACDVHGCSFLNGG